MHEQIPIIVKPSKKKAKIKRIYIAIVISLVLLIIVSFLYFTAKSFFDDFARSAWQATSKLESQ